MQVIDFKKAQAIIGGWDPFAAAIQGASAGYNAGVFGLVGGFIGGFFSA